MAGETEADPAVIPDGEILYRRVKKLHVDTANQATSFAFKPRSDDDDGVSLFSASQRSLEQVIEGHETFGVVQITAGEARTCGAVLERDRNDPSHVVMRLPLSHGTRRLLADKARTIRLPAA